MKEDISLFQLYQQWQNLHLLSLKESTILNYNYLFNSFNFLSSEPLSKIDEQTIILCFKQIAKNNAPTTLKLKWNFLNKLLEFAKQQTYIANNPMHNLPQPRIQQISNQKFKFLTEHELASFLSDLKHHNFKYYVLCRLASMSGMRIGELMSLTWPDINFKKQCLTVNKTCILNKNFKPTIAPPKTKASNRKIYLDQKTLSILEDWHKINSNFYLFPNQKGTLASTSIPKNWIIRYRKKYPNFQDLSFHTFRHTHASMLFAHNVPIKIIQNRLGHASIRTTMDIYTHLSTDYELENIKNFFNEITI